MKRPVGATLAAVCVVCIIAAGCSVPGDKPITYATGDSFASATGLPPLEGWHSPADPRDPTKMYRPVPPFNPDTPYFPNSRGQGSYGELFNAKRAEPGTFINGGFAGAVGIDLVPLAGNFVPDDYQRMDLVLFSIGGNDAGFTAIAANCFVFRNGDGCNSLMSILEGTGPDSLRQIIVPDDPNKKGLQAHVGDLMDKFPKAQFVWVGYPLFDETPSLNFCRQADDHLAQCTAGQQPVFNASERLRRLIEQADQYLETTTRWLAITKQRAISYHSLLKLFYSHGVDQDNPTKPDRWIFSKDDGGALYHPNATGHQAIADDLAHDPALRGLLPAA